MIRRSLLGSLILLSLVGTARAQDVEPEAYPWRFHRFDALDYAVTGVAAVGYFSVELGVEPATEAKWSSTTFVDDAVRDWLRADSAQGRARADFWSDLFWYAPMGLPWLDLTIPAGRGNWDTAWQMTHVNVQAFAISGFLTRSGHRLIARERPDVAPCEQDPAYNGDRCSAGSYASYPSGHTSTASLGAGLACAHHLKLGLLGSDVADGLVCGTAVTMAAGAGVLRIVADRHHATDVVTGAAVGFGSGLVLPLLRHYREEARSEDGAAVRWTVMPAIQGDDGLGVGAYGWF